MGLVDYSDSDSSDAEIATSVIPSATCSSKSTFQKAVDRSNPGKIKVSLPHTFPNTESNVEEPPTKRAKVGNGAFGSFNSFLPPPKRTGANSGKPLSGTNSTASGGLRAGVNLKTSPAQGFTRDICSALELPGQSPDELRGPALLNVEEGDVLPIPDTQPEITQKAAAEVKSVGKPLMFKPLSVTRKVTKKNHSNTAAVAQSVNPQRLKSTTSMETQPEPRPKVSLFSISTDQPDPPTPASFTGDYQPLIYDAGAEEALEGPGERLPDYSHMAEHEIPHHPAREPAIPKIGAQSLDDIASDLGLSAADRRQLFGRQKGTAMGKAPSATTIINFNTDREYQHNEELRAAGEQVVHNPVRAIAPGKHSLKQLVNAASSQKEALEESFARGKSTRAEASSRYGW
ncbi:MAG: hypothetical protein M1818_007163 [Claussenomyces sp. TS43310]|nr:MAG: hypothetical protein M1818_007163 [Claussenomyces sp. TS43310]